MAKSNLNVAILHPDLGIGGAERLIVDIALSLKEQNNVTIYTSHYDPSHAFEETKSLSVVSIGEFLPMSILGKLYIICSFLRQLWLVWTLIFNGQLAQKDLIIIDQLSYCIPIIQRFKNPKAKVLFYCHFPDKLLASHEGSLRKVYRSLWDYIEEKSTSAADLVLVNSKFTKRVVRNAFKNIKHDLEVLYPCVADPPVIINDLNFDFKYFLSINRFEMKKGIELAITAFNEIPERSKNVKLIIAGGCDSRVAENIQYLEKLKALASELGLKYQVNCSDDYSTIESEVDIIFWLNVTNETKFKLINSTSLLLYTPRNEHFGIVPIEAMNLGKLVLADYTGGPLETIANYYQNSNNFTGFNVNINDTESWAKTMQLALTLDPIQYTQNCKKRIQKHFSAKSMQVHLNDIIQNKLDL